MPTGGQSWKDTENVGLSSCLRRVEAIWDLQIISDIQFTLISHFVIYKHLIIFFKNPIILLKQSNAHT